MDFLTLTQRSERMRLIRGKDTKPEMAVRRMVRRIIGPRYRLHVRSLPGRPDLVVGRARKVIFVHGCFWHRHPRCRRATLPTSRREFWIPKLRATQLRDRANRERLAATGWEVLIVWECQLRRPAEVEASLMDFLPERRCASRGGLV